MDVLRSKTPLTKRKAAFLHTCAKLFKQDNGIQARRVYLWTFTSREVVADEIAMARWNHLNVLLTRKYKKLGGCPGVRVVEDHPGPYGHPGGHGLHFHALIARRLDVNEVRRLAVRAGFGRINVKKCNQQAASYLTKYLTKGKDFIKKGTRRWGMIAGFKGTRVKDIEVQSELAENCRRTYQVLGRWSREVFIAVNRLTVKYGHCLDWPQFPELSRRVEFQRGDEWLPEWAEHVIRPVYGTIKTYNTESQMWVTTLVTEPVHQPF